MNTDSLESRVMMLEAKLKALEDAHHQLVWKVVDANKWEPQGCDDTPPGMVEPFCYSCRTCHNPLSGCPGDIGPMGPGSIFFGKYGPVGMPGLLPGETKEEHMQRWRDALAHNELLFTECRNAKE